MLAWSKNTKSSHIACEPASFRHQSSIILASTQHRSGINPALFSRHHADIIRASIQHHRGINSATFRNQIKPTSFRHQCSRHQSSINQASTRRQFSIIQASNQHDSGINPTSRHQGTRLATNIGRPSSSHLSIQLSCFVPQLALI